MADVGTIVGVLVAYPVGAAVLHGVKFLAPLILPGLVARPAPPSALPVVAADVERRLVALEIARQHDRDRAEDRDRELMGLLADIRADVGRARRRNEGG